MNHDNKVTLRFGWENQFGEQYSQESHFEVFTDLGETEIDCIGERLNVFLRQIGHIRNNDYIFMESVTEDELIALEDFLDSLREDDVDDEV